MLWHKGAAALLQQEGDASSLGSISSSGCGLMWHGLYFFFFFLGGGDVNVTSVLAMGC